MLTIKTSLADLDFKQLMAVYIEGNEENAADLYPDLPKEEGIARAEQDFYRYLETFFSKEKVLYAVWEEEGQYVSVLRLEPYEDGLLMEALETKPSCRKKGYAAQLITAVKNSVSEKIYSHVSKQNTPSLRTHEKRGFERILEYASYTDGSVSQNQCTFCIKNRKEC